MQRALSACRPVAPEWHLLGVPTLRWILMGPLGIFGLAGGNGPREYVGTGGGLSGVPPLLWVIRGLNGARSCGAKTQRCSMWVRKFGDAASESLTLLDATGPVNM